MFDASTPEAGRPGPRGGRRRAWRRPPHRQRSIPHAGRRPSSCERVPVLAPRASAGSGSPSSRSTPRASGIFPPRAWRRSQHPQGRIPPTKTVCAAPRDRAERLADPPKNAPRVSARARHVDTPSPPPAKHGEGRVCAPGRRDRAWTEGSAPSPREPGVGRGTPPRRSIRTSRAIPEDRRGSRQYAARGSPEPPRERRGPRALDSRRPRRIAARAGREQIQTLAKAVFGARCAHAKTCVREL